MCASKNRESVLVCICWDIKSSLEENQQDVGILHYCIKNTWQTHFRGREDSVAPLVAGWYGEGIRSEQNPPSAELEWL